jgi:hypothetical protein
MVGVSASEMARVKMALCFAVGLPLFLQAMLLVDGAAAIQLDAGRASQLLAIATSLCGLCAIPFMKDLSSVEGDDGEHGRARGFQPGRAALVALAAWATFAWIQLFVVSWLRPVYDWDGLYYHIPTIHGWMQAGYVSWVDAGFDVPFVNGYPMAVEAIGFFVATLAGSERLVDAGNLWYWPIGILAVFAISRRLGASKLWSSAAAFALAGAPLFIAESTTAYVDVAFACAVMAMLAAAVEWVEEEGFGNAVLLGLAGGLAIASKGLGLPFLTIIAASALCFVLLRRSPRSRWLPAGQLALAVSLALALGGGWFLRNWIHTGNPIYPVGLQAAGVVIFEGVDARAHALLNMPLWLSDWPVFLRPLVSWTQPDAPVVHYGAISGLGYIWLAAGAPAAIALLVDTIANRRRSSGILFLILTSLCILLWQPASWWARFTLWVHALGLPCIAIVMTRSWILAKGHQRVSLATLCTAIFLTAMTESVLAVRHQWQDGLVEPGGLRYRSSADYVFPGIELAAGFDELFASRKVARGPWSRWSTLMGGILSSPLGVREIRALPAAPGTQAVEDLTRDGFDYVLWDVEAAGECPVEIRVEYELIGFFGDRDGLQLELWRFRRSQNLGRAR